MSFLTEYFDNYRQHPIRKTKPCAPENRYAPIKGKWLDPKTGTDDKQWSDEDIKKFIKETMANLRGRSTYYSDYCAHLPPDLKTRPFVARVKPQKPCPVKGAPIASKEEEYAPLEPLDIQGTELMKLAREIYERDLDKPVLEPLPTHHRILGYARPRLYGCGISEYANSVAYLGYVLMRDGLTKRRVIHNGERPVWGLPPEAERQPMLDIVPYEGESLY